MGSGVWPLAMATRPAKLPVGDCAGEGEKCLEAAWGLALHAGGGAARVVPRLWIKPIERLVPVSCGDCSLSTSGLSTWWSTTALGETWF